MNNYINEAIKHNHDARQASWQVEEYRQRVKYSLGQEFPHLRMGANYVGSHVPDFGRVELPINDNAFVLPFIVTYEPDFLLKNRDKTRSAKKEYEAYRYDEKSVYLSLASDVATAYVNILQFDSLIKVQEQVYASKSERLNREAKKFERGVIDNERFNIVKKEIETAKSDLETLKRNRDTGLTQLALLIGASPAAISDLKRSTLDEFDYHYAVPDTLPSEVIYARPDVMAAEYRLERAKIDVRVARKELLPSFNVMGILAFNNLFPGNFFDWGTTVAALTAGASQTLFKGGMKIATLKINKAMYEELFENYRQTDLNAIKEVNDALVIVKYDTQVDTNTIIYLNLQKKDFDDNLKKYSRGVISYPSILSQQETLLNTAQSQIRTKTTRLVDYFTLYKAVGGQL